MTSEKKKAKVKLCTKKPVFSLNYSSQLTFKCYFTKSRQLRYQSSCFFSRCPALNENPGNIDNSPVKQKALEEEQMNLPR